MANKLSRSEKLKQFNMDPTEKKISDKLLDRVYDYVIYNKAYQQSYTITRSEKLKAIGLEETTLVSELSDEHLTTFYKKVLDATIARKSNRREKLIKLGFSENTREEDLSDKMLDKLYEEKAIGSIIATKQASSIILTNTHPKYVLTLKFLNKILEVLNKNQINDILEFKGIRKVDIIKNECVELIDGFLKEFVEVFGKAAIEYRRRNIITTYILTILKNIVSICGYNFVSYKCLDQQEQVDGTIKRVYCLKYSINST